MLWSILRDVKGSLTWCSVKHRVRDGTSCCTVRSLTVFFGKYVMQMFTWCQLTGKCRRRWRNERCVDHGFFVRVGSCEFVDRLSLRPNVPIHAHHTIYHEQNSKVQARSSKNRN